MAQYHLKSKLHRAFSFTFSVFSLLLSASSVLAQTTSNDPNNTSNISTSFNLTFALVFVALIAFFFAAAFAIMYFSCGGPNPLTDANATARTTPAEDGSEWTIPVVRQSGLDKSVLDTFPIIKFSEIKGLNLGTLECAVCLSEYNNSDTLRILPGCCHVFHPACIDSWLSNHDVCPICRASLTNQNIMPTESQTQTGNDGVIIKGTERFTLRLPDHVLRQIEVQRGYKLSASIAGSGYQGTPMSKSGRVWAFIRTFSSRRGQEVGGGSRSIRLGSSLHRNPTLGRNGSIQEIPMVRSGSVRTSVHVVVSGIVPVQSGPVRNQTEMAASGMVLPRSVSSRDQTSILVRSGSVRGESGIVRSNILPMRSSSVRDQIDMYASTADPKQKLPVRTETDLVESGEELVLPVSGPVSVESVTRNSVFASSRF